MADPLDDGTKAPDSDVDDDSLDFVLQDYHDRQRSRELPDSVLETLTKEHGEMPPVLLWGPDSEGDGPMVRPETTEEMQALHRRYEIHGELARGGIGIVYKGRDADLGRDIAIKMLRNRHTANREMVHRFVEEAQVGGQLQHPGIVPVYELGMREDRRPYFTMKLVKGQTLAALLAERKDPGEDLRRFLSIVEQVCQTMAYAHSRNVIHRDLKPANIMVGSFGEVQVMDWGLAKVLAAGGVADERKAKREAQETMIETVRNESNGSQSVTGSVMGTLAYMPPEQARGEVEQLDQRSDVFSLGAILFEVLTGRPPYVGETTSEVREKAAGGDLEDALTCLRESEVDPELEQIVRSCLAPARRSRPRDAGVVAAHIAEYLSALEQRARKAELAAAKATVKAQEERRARRLTLALAASVLLVALLAVGGYLWVHEARRSRSRDIALKVDQALREAQLFRGKAEASGMDDPMHWEHAVAAARRAQSLAQEIEIEDGTLRRTNAFLEELQSQAEQATRDSRLVSKLDALRSQHAIDPDTNRYLTTILDAFRDYGLDLVTLPPRQTAQSITSSSICSTLTRYLEGFVLNLRFEENQVPIDWKKVAQIISRVDPDPLRTKVRDAMFSKDLEALRAIATSDEIKECDPRLLNNLATTLQQLGDPTLAVSLHRMAQRLSPRDYWINRNLGRALQHADPPQLDEALRFYTATLAIRETWDAWDSLGVIFAMKGRFADGLECFQKAVELKRDNGALFTHLGRAYLETGNRQQALECMRKAVQAEPGYVHGHGWLGQLLLEQQDYEGAIVSLRKAVALDPRHFTAQFNLALSLLQKGDVEAAIPEFQKAVKLRPRHALLHLRLGHAYEQTRQVQDAIDCYAKAVELDPKLAGAYHSLGVLLSNKKGEYDAAIEAFKKVIALQPGNDVAYSNLGVTYRKKGELDASIQAYQESLRIKPAACAYHGLGQTYQNKGDMVRTIQAWDEAVRLEPENPR